MQELHISGLYRVKKNDLKKCAKNAAKAFMEDETSKFLLSSKLTEESLFEYYLVVYNAIYSKMYIFADSEEINGFVIFTSIEKAEITLWDFISCGGLKVILSVGFDLVLRSLAYEKNCINIRKPFISENDWYIFQFGVVPEKQGVGLGSKIIKPVLAWFDSNNVACYLETQTTLNVEIYKHLGFNLKSVDNLPKKQVKQFAMLRN